MSKKNKQHQTALSNSQDRFAQEQLAQDSGQVVTLAEVVAQHQELPGGMNEPSQIREELARIVASGAALELPVEPVHTPPPAQPIPLIKMKIFDGRGQYGIQPAQDGVNYTIPGLILARDFDRAEDFKVQLTETWGFFSASDGTPRLIGKWKNVTLVQRVEHATILAYDGELPKYFVHGDVDKFETHTNNKKKTFGKRF